MQQTESSANNTLILDKNVLSFSGATKESSFDFGEGLVSQGIPQLPMSTSHPSHTENDPNYRKMYPFPSSSINDFKHVLYNLLVENYNNPMTSCLLQPFSVVDQSTGKRKHGFKFNSMENPGLIIHCVCIKKKLPELYALHVKKARLDWEDRSSVFIEDLYRFYLRAVVELMSKYWKKVDKFTFTYDEVPLFIPNECLKDAEERLKSMKSRSRMKRKATNKDKDEED
jgi:hypothetical protein